MCSFYKLSFYQLSSYLNSFFIVFTILYTIFYYLWILLYQRQGSVNTTLEDRFLVLFYLIPFYRVPSLLFSRMLSLLNFNVIVNKTGWECFLMSFIGNRLLYTRPFDNILIDFSFVLWQVLSRYTFHIIVQF